MIKSRRMIALMEGSNKYTKLWSGNLEQKRPCGRPRSRWVNIRMDFREIGWKLWNGFIWLRIRTSGGISQTQY
jgi:hypothetical protein